MTKIVRISEDFITLGQFLKLVDVISSGGQAKWYLQEYVVLVDGEPENRRGRKLYPKSRIEIPDQGVYVLQAETGQDQDRDQ